MPVDSGLAKPVSSALTLQIVLNAPHCSWRSKACTQSGPWCNLKDSHTGCCCPLNPFFDRENISSAATVDAPCDGIVDPLTAQSVLFHRQSIFSNLNALHCLWRFKACIPHQAWRNWYSQQVATDPFWTRIFCQRLQPYLTMLVATGITGTLLMTPLASLPENILSEVPALSYH